jgi:hypothetical protein
MQRACQKAFNRLRGRPDSGLREKRARMVDTSSRGTRMTTFLTTLSRSAMMFQGDFGIGISDFGLPLWYIIANVQAFLTTQRFPSAAHE